MIFPSYIFLLAFLPLVLLGWYGMRGLQLRLAFLTLASYFFYGWWDYRFTLLMLGSTGLDYICGSRIHRAEGRQRRFWLLVSITGNLGSLGFFKYYDFFVASVASGLEAVGLQVSAPTLGLILPIGISFYTFQSLSYSIDIYRGRCRPTRNFLLFTSYVSMFPQLVAGPIVRYRDIEGQLEALPERRADPGQISDGVWLFVLGLIKKIWIADLLAPGADYVFDVSAEPALITAWLGVLSYTFQLYFDFSAYSDMALGLGKILGFEFPVNFSSPYKSASISEFWGRWHISLSQWLRDYLFIPLGGSRGTVARTLRNIVITMFLGGLWHGAAWTFVIWGSYHGFLLVADAVWKRAGLFKIPRPVAVLMTFLAVTVGWVVFRAPTFERAGAILSGLIGLHGVEAFFDHELGLFLPAVFERISTRVVAVCAVAAGLAFFAPNSHELPRPRGAGWAFLLALIVVLTLTRLMKATPFLYFQF